MNWEALGAIGETLGAVAVFVTLAYLAVQVRYARQEVRRSISTSRADAHRASLTVLADDRLLGPFAKANAVEGAPLGPFQAYAMERWGITQAEATLMGSALTTGWQYRLQLIPHVGDMSPIERHDFDQTIRNLYGQQSVHRVYYQTVLKPYQHPDAIRYIESVLAQPA